MINDVHSLDCPRCKMREKFYAEFNRDPQKNKKYFGLISYTNYYLLPEKELSTKSQCCRSSNVCLLQWEKDWAVEPLSKRNSFKKKLRKHYFHEDRDLRTRCSEKTPDSSLPFPVQEHSSNLTSVRKPESFSEPSPNDTVSPNNLETTKDIDKLTKKSPSKNTVAAKEPKLGTLKRKRWNWEKLKPNESYEDDLFEERKLKRITLKSNYPSRGESIIGTPKWSVPLSPVELDRTPGYEDCYSPTELQNIRKEAEEYQYRRNKRKKGINEKTEDSKTEIKGNLETYKILEAVRDKLKALEKKDCDSDHDSYFTDEEETKQEEKL